MDICIYVYFHTYTHTCTIKINKAVTLKQSMLFSNTSTSNASTTIGGDWKWNQELPESNPHGKMTYSMDSSKT